MTELHPEDQKIIMLARAAQARSGAESGAAVRDVDGRTYAAVPVQLATIQLSALQVAVVMAASSGAQALEAAAVASAGPADGPGLAAVRDAGGAGVPVILTDLGGVVTEIRHT